MIDGNLPLDACVRCVVGRLGISKSHSGKVVIDRHACMLLLLVLFFGLPVLCLSRLSMMLACDVWSVD